MKPRLDRNTKMLGPNRRLHMLVWVITLLTIGVMGPVAWQGVARAENDKPLPRLPLSVDQAQYGLGEPVTISGTVPTELVSDDAGLHLYIDRLGREVHQAAITLKDDGTWEYTWDPPAQVAGYGAEVLLVAKGNGLARDGTRPVGEALNLADAAGGPGVIAWGEIAFDVAHHWSDHPRYGFLSEFGRLDPKVEAEAFAKMNRLHLNGLQFYDWMYRHEDLVPKTPIFTDSLGRILFLESIESRIAYARSYSMAPMAYTAIYAASHQFYRQHRNWGLHDEAGRPIDFGDGYLALMNPARGFGWNEYLMDQFDKVLDRFDFDGIHVDQYGYPKVAYPAPESGSRGAIQMGIAFRHFLDDMRARLERRTDRHTLVFNAVTNWPAALVAGSGVDFNYVEVWTPYDTYGDIETIITGAYEASRGKATVIAAYVDPAEEATVRLLNAVIAAHGATHIEMGEGDGMLADPYFPLFERVSPDLWDAQVRHYDTIVRYKEWLAGPRTRLDPTGRVFVNGNPVQFSPRAQRIHTVLYEGDGFYNLSLINLTAASTLEWTAAQPIPETIEGITVTAQVPRAIRNVWSFSPDSLSTRATPLNFAMQLTDDGEITVSLEIPSLKYWTAIVIEWEEAVGDELLSVEIAGRGGDAPN